MYGSGANIVHENNTYRNNRNTGYTWQTFNPDVNVTSTISERIKADIMNGRLLTEQNSVNISEFIKDGVEDMYPWLNKIVHIIWTHLMCIKLI